MDKEQKKKTNIPLLVIILIAVGIVVAMAIMKLKMSNEKFSKGIESDDITEKVQEENPLMEFNNTENVKIDNGKKENISEALLADKSFKGMEIKEIKLYAENGITNFSARIINNSGSDYPGGKVTMVFTNKDGTEYNRIEGVLPAIKDGETNGINAGTIADLSNAYNVKFE